jgi:hypothetical protein
MAEATLEQRISVLENAIQELRDELNAQKPSTDWLKNVLGSMKDEPAFDEVLAYGRAIRESDRPEEEAGN